MDDKHFNSVDAFAGLLRLVAVILVLLVIAGVVVWLW